MELVTLKPFFKLVAAHHHWPNAQRAVCMIEAYGHCAIVPPLDA
jgi:hypothetical protein